MKKKALIIIIFLFFLFFIIVSKEENENGKKLFTKQIKIIDQKEADYQYVKYREDLVDLNHSRWEYLNTSNSSWIRGAWYDEKEQYMIIDLNGTKYHYCGIYKNVWNKFKNADSFGKNYNKYIKGNYDCRNAIVPEY